GAALPRGGAPDDWATGRTASGPPATGSASQRRTTMNLSQRFARIDRTLRALNCLLRWPARLSIAAPVVALAGLLGAVEPSRSTAKLAESSESPRPNPAQQAKANPEARAQVGQVVALDKVIAALRAEEEKYRDIEYTLRRTTRKIDPKAPE